MQETEQANKATVTRFNKEVIEAVETGDLGDWGEWTEDSNSANDAPKLAALKGVSS